MARDENDARWQGLGTVTVRAPGERDKVGSVTALARCLRRMLAGAGEKTLATGKTLRVASWFTSTGEHHTMKDVNGNNAFVHVGGVTYISAAHVATTVVDISRTGSKASAKGLAIDHNWQVDGKGEFSLEHWDQRTPMVTWSTNRPRVEAFLEHKKVGELTYDIKIDTTNATATLEALQRTISDTKLGVDLAWLVRINDQRKAVEQAVLEILENEKRQGGLLWQAGTVNNFTCQGAQVAPAVKSLDDLAREVYDDRRNQMIVESVDARWQESYRIANHRLSLRAALNK